MFIVVVILLLVVGVVVFGGIKVTNPNPPNDDEIEKNSYDAALNIAYELGTHTNLAWYYNIIPTSWFINVGGIVERLKNTKYSSVIRYYQQFTGGDLLTDLAYYLDTYNYEKIVKELKKWN